MADVSTIEGVRRDVLSLLQNYAASGGKAHLTQQILNSQLHILQLIEDLDRKIAVLATPKEKPRR
jgi:hypothetical protein